MFPVSPACWQLRAQVASRRCWVFFHRPSPRVFPHDVFWKSKPFFVCKSYIKCPISVEWLGNFGQDKVFCCKRGFGGMIFYAANMSWNKECDKNVASCSFQQALFSLWHHLIQHFISKIWATHSANETPVMTWRHFWGSLNRSLF